MSVSAIFINRPVATTLITFGIVLAGIVSFSLLPVSPMPRVDLPTISINVSLPGASPQTMSTTVVTPLERSMSRIAGITEMTSSSAFGTGNIIVQFELDRNIDGAARDIQAAIAAARADLPATLRNNPIYRKANPADAPIMIFALTSDTMTKAQIFDYASTTLAPKFSQIDGIGNVVVGGSSLPAVRIELNPMALNKYGVSLEQVRTSISAANSNLEKGTVDEGDRQWQIATNSQAKTAAEYMSLIVTYRNKNPIPLSSVGTAIDSVEDLRHAGIADGKPAVVVFIFKQPNANIIETVNRIHKIMPELRAAMPAALNVPETLDQTITIRASLHDVERTLLISVILVVLVVFAFLRNGRASLISSITLPICIAGTFYIMYLCGFSLNNFSLMALTVSTGFVMDDAIVVLENTMRHIEKGMSPIRAALNGAKEVGPTVVSMTISLIAVFIPMLFIGGVIGKLFHEFAITLSAAVLISFLFSVTTTPMMCSKLLKPRSQVKHGSLFFISERVFNWIQNQYGKGLDVVLRHSRITLLVVFAVTGMNIYLYTIVPKGLLPIQDTGLLMGAVVADESTSFQAMASKLSAYVDLARQDPAVESVSGFTGGNQINTGRVFIILKPRSERKVSADEVINRLRDKLASVPGASLFLQARQEIWTGGRLNNALYQYTLQGDSLKDLGKWSPQVLQTLQNLPELVDVNTTQKNNGLQTSLSIDRETALRLGLTQKEIDNTLYNAFGQRQVSIIYNARNQYHVVMEVAPEYWQHPETLNNIFVSSASGRLVPLSAFSHFETKTTALAVNHQGQFVATTISFNLAPNVILSDAVDAINNAIEKMALPSTIRGNFQGTARTFQDSFKSMPFLIVASLLTIYIALGVLYESLVQPITILSTIPSASVGAILTLIATNMELDLMAFLGIIVLIGIVKRNAIIMVDFALVAQRTMNMAPFDAIKYACLQRFRPIMMTTMVAMFGAMPLTINFGMGSEWRQPLGVVIIGGLIFSQMLTLFTTPVVYLYMERFRLMRKPETMKTGRAI